MSNSATPWTAARQASLSITSSQSPPEPMSKEWCHPAISSSVVPFSSCPHSFPESGYFPMSQLFAWGGQSVGVSASASVLPMNIQDWSPLGWTGCIFLQPKGLSRVFSNATVQKHLPVSIRSNRTSKLCYFKTVNFMVCKFYLSKAQLKSSKFCFVSNLFQLQQFLWDKILLNKKISTNLFSWVRVLKTWNFLRLLAFCFTV